MKKKYNHYEIKRTINVLVIFKADTPHLIFDI